MSNPKIRCHDIRYRQGFIEVAPGIHAEHINLEVWNIHPDWDISETLFDDANLNDSAFVGNVELEINLQQAKELVARLQAGIREIEQPENNDA
jgi:hypothetical protein